MSSIPGRPMMSSTNRRQHLMLLAASLAMVISPARAASQATAQAGDPESFIRAIYVRAAAGRGDGGGTFVYHTAAQRAQHLSKDLRSKWQKAEAHTKKGDIGPVEFDPVTNSQDPSLKSYQLKSERREDNAASVAVTMVSGHGGRTTAADEIVRYDLVRENGRWAIDDIRGAVDGKPWSIRAILAEFMRY